jgi:hypothetical protein
MDMKKIYLFLAIGAAISITLAACSADKIVPPVAKEKMYRVEAILVKDLHTDSASVFVTLTKSDAAYKGANVFFGLLPIDTVAAGYFRRFGPNQIYSDSSYVLTIVDDTLLDTEFTFTMPDSFVIDTRYRFFTGGEESVAWSPSVNADGYILATVPPDTANYDGYSAYVPTTTGTIPAATFLDGLNDRIVGTHMIYAAAYIGAPVKSPAFAFDIPSTGGPADNVSGDDIAGRIAAMVIASPDSIIVTN